MSRRVENIYGSLATGHVPPEEVSSMNDEDIWIVVTISHNNNKNSNNHDAEAAAETKRDDRSNCRSTNWKLVEKKGHPVDPCARTPLLMTLGYFTISPYPIDI